MNRRLFAWSGLVLVLTTLGYAARASDGEPPRDALYRYDSFVAGLVQYALILLVVLAIARGHEGLLALRRPSSWKRVLGYSALVLVVTYAAAAAVESFADPGREQGLLPDGWDSSRALPFALNFALVAAVAPVAEELAFRGLGYSLLARYGRVLAIVAVGLAFGLVHGLLEALPILAVFGAGLALLRERTGSVLPSIGVHALFNAVALVLAVTT